MVGSGWPPVSSGRSRLPVSASDMEYREPRSQIERPFRSRKPYAAYLLVKKEPNPKIVEDNAWIPYQKITKENYKSFMKQVLARHCPLHDHRRALITRWLALELMRRALAVYHPRDTELIRQHPIAHRPKRLLQRHRHSSAFRQCCEDALRARRLLDIQRHVETLRCDVVLGQFVAAHQRHIAHHHPGVQDFPAPLRRHFVCQRRVGESDRHGDFPAEILLVELKGRGAVAGEVEVWIQFH
jgi:hypothetical protein